LKGLFPLQELLTAMSKQNVAPNVGTLNAVLEAVSSMGPQRHVRTYALRALAEFRYVGVQPSLASFYFLLITFCKESEYCQHTENYFALI
jgi:pentatricopeptide repeat domain-containing protein 3